MKKPPIVLMIYHDITNIFLMPAHNYMDKINLLVRSSSLIFHSGDVAAILWSDNFQNLKIQVKMINIVMKFNTFI